MPEDQVQVEVAMATPDQQDLLSISVPAASTIGEVVMLSGLAGRYPTLDLMSLPKGIWGQVLPDEHRVSEGDRIEIYRPLLTDPKTARRQRAQKN